MAHESAPYSLEHMGTPSATVSKITPPVGASASSECADLRGRSPQVAVGQGRVSHSHDLTFFSRVHRVQREIEAGRTVPDADLLQHAKDLTELMEEAFAAWQERGEFDAFEAALKHLRQRDAARRLLSQEWQERREAEILAGCSAGFFIDAGDKSRAQIAANEEKAA